MTTHRRRPRHLQIQWKAAAARSKMAAMEKVLRKFSSFAESDRADRAYYRQLSPHERLDILLELVARYREEFGEAAQGFARV